MLGKVSKIGGFVRLGVRAKKPLPKRLIRFVTGAPRDTTLATVGSKCCTTPSLVMITGVIRHRVA
jgi:hypothetical protein